MTDSESDFEKMKQEAERLGKEQMKIDARNKKRIAKGRPPLPDLSEAMEIATGRRRHRTGDATTVDAADALKLFEIRKARMVTDSSPDDIDEMEELLDRGIPRANAVVPDQQAEAAIRAAESARRIQDLKNGRIDHVGNWSDGGQKLERGDETKLVDKLIGDSIRGNETSQDDGTSAENVWRQDPEPAQEKNGKSSKASKASRKSGTTPELGEFIADLYKRLGTSFDGIERTLSDLQGRVSEIVTATTPSESSKALAENTELPGLGAGSFSDFLATKTPVVFDVGGTRMTFDAICVFMEPSCMCLTVVSKIDSAKINPKPGTHLKLSYSIDGEAYADDPVTYLGTRFDLPMLGLSFVGFIRDKMVALLDVEAGVSDGSEDTVSESE